jgi:hypothetical protein
MIHYQLQLWTEPQITFNHLIDYKLAVLGIDIKELPTSQHHPGCVIQDHAELDSGPTSFMPVDMDEEAHLGSDETFWFKVGDIAGTTGAQL